ncbi:MAG: aminoacetone oxidase family FAD-binding enzyme [Clostridia bacterium]|nr:aminoacetone oxidase family FAD-binding enzyme [Clostridia bacterium]
METYKVIIIGGGAAGLFLANILTEYGEKDLLVLERGERVGKKLSATGNGQGNITNLRVAERGGYFSSDPQAEARLGALLSVYGAEEFREFWAKRGVLLSFDERGRAYPAGRQASALTDALRFYAEQNGAELRTGARVYAIRKTQNGFVAEYEKDGEKRACQAEKLVLCTGGKAAKNFGTDGTAYALAQSFGHTVTPLYPSLVQLKTETAPIKTLKGIRVVNGGLTAHAPSGEYTVRGDIIFTDYGVSGDAVFRVSAFITPEVESGQVTLSIDFLPEVGEQAIFTALQKKRAAYPALSDSELLLGVVNNQIGRAVMKRAAGDMQKAAGLVKAFPLRVMGHLGFDYAQVTKGGIPLRETTENFESKRVKGLYFAGETLDADGQCGGFNLHFAYASARAVAESITRGQV